MDPGPPYISVCSELVCSSVSNSFRHGIIPCTQQRRKLNGAEKKFYFSNEEAALKKQWLLLFPNVMACYT